MVPILNYRTEVEAARTAAEIQTMLAKAGASSIQLDYVAGDPIGLAFSLETPLGREAYRLPANVDGVFRVLTDQADRGQVRRSFVTRKHARRVAWRILKDWIEAQLAIIAAGMVTFDQVMLPYAVVHDKITVYDAWRERQLALSDGSNRVGSEAQTRLLPAVRDI